jgi:hypothetical protein
MPSGEYVDPRAWADDTDLHRRLPGAPGPARKRTGDVRIMSEGQRVPVPPPSAPPPVPSAGAARSPAATSARPPAVPGARPPAGRIPTTAGLGAATQPGFQVNEPRFHPTPPPDKLAQVLEPGGQMIRRMPKGLVISVLVAALVLGTVLAAWLVSG